MSGVQGSKVGNEPTLVQRECSPGIPSSQLVSVSSHQLRLHSVMADLPGALRSY